MRRRFGLWLLTGPRPFEDPRIWREDSQSYQLQTPFQRAEGVRYVGRRAPRYCDVFTGFGSCGRSRSRSVSTLLKGWFRHGPVPRHNGCRWFLDVRQRFREPQDMCSSLHRVYVPCQSMVRYLSDIFEIGGKMKPNSPINPDGYAAGYRGR